jgi:hypothetical protein
MGAVSFSLDVELVTSLKKVLPLPIFVETGTFKGDTVNAMLPYFDRFITAELSEPLWKEVAERFAGEEKVEPYLGNSPDVIAKFSPALNDSSVLYWLDAHWCVADDTSGEKSQCPLLEEIHAIGQLNDQSVILIDDARLFLAAPPAPHEISQWPSIDSIITALKQTSSQHELSVVNDVIIFYPKLVRDSVISYAKKQGVDWLRASQSLLENMDLRRALEEKHEALMRLTESLVEKEEALMQLTESLVEKEVVIQEINTALESCRASMLNRDKGDIQ